MSFAEKLHSGNEIISTHSQCDTSNNSLNAIQVMKIKTIAISNPYVAFAKYR
jgi:hypothetical protein